MKIPLRIQWLLWWSSIANRSRIEKLVKITKGGDGARSILFLLPQGQITAPTVSHLIKRDIDNDFREIRYIVHENGLKYYSEQLKLNMISYTDDDLNWWGEIQSSIILDRIKTIKYDAIVNMNQKFNPTMTLLALKLEVPIKIGFESPFAENIYTMIIQSSETGFFEKNYEKVEDPKDANLIVLNTASNLKLLKILPSSIGTLKSALISTFLLFILIESILLIISRF